MRYSVGVDIGGTFTDVVLLGEDGSVRTHKISSTPHDYSQAVVGGVREIADAATISARAIDEVIHATTVATNTILEQRGARTALLTTAGFRDVLEMRRLRIPVLYDLQYDKPPPLVPRRHRFEVAERMGPRGEIWRALDRNAVARIADQIAAAEIEAVAVVFLHSYANAVHEREAVAILRQRLGRDVYVTCSADILPEIREYERTSTAVVNAYVGPVVDRYLRSLASQLHGAGIDAPIRIMQSGGGVLTAPSAMRKPACLVESGPAAGVIACARLVREAGYANAISFDMGGTTAKAAMIEAGEPARTTEYEVGAGINLSSKLVKGGGYAIKLPFIDVSEIGAGGGSLVTLDASGSLKVGPRSAGAMPGPVCYGLGGEVPTFTDAVVTLGYLNPEHLVGGRVKIDAEAARQALTKAIATPLGLSLDVAAHGVFAIAVANMTRAVKAVTTYRGRDPRDFVLVAFGGNGPVAAVEIARSLAMPRILIPPAPGVFSALGLLFSDVEHEFPRTVMRRMDDLAATNLDAVFRELEAEAREVFRAEGHDLAAVEFRRVAELRYSGQAYELVVPVAPGLPDKEAMLHAFHAEHERTYGHCSIGDPVDLINAKVIGRESRTAHRRLDRDAVLAAGISAVVARPPRRAYFGARWGHIETPILSRAEIAAGITGPAIIEEFDATCVIPPEATARLDAHGNIEIETGDAA